MVRFFILTSKTIVIVRKIICNRNISFTYFLYFNLEKYRNKIFYLILILFYDFSRYNPIYNDMLNLNFSEINKNIHFKFYKTNLQRSISYVA